MMDHWCFFCHFQEVQGEFQSDFISTADETFQTGESRTTGRDTEQHRRIYLPTSHHYDKEVCYRKPKFVSTLSLLLAILKHGQVQCYDGNTRMWLCDCTFVWVVLLLSWAMNFTVQEKEHNHFPNWYFYGSNTTNHSKNRQKMDKDIMHMAQRIQLSPLRN